MDNYDTTDQSGGTKDLLQIRLNLNYSLVAGASFKGHTDAFPRYHQWEHLKDPVILLKEFIWLDSPSHYPPAPGENYCCIKQYAVHQFGEFVFVL